MEVEFTARAQKQLIQLEVYLATRFYPESSARFVQRLTEACHSLGLVAGQGTHRDDLRPGVRSTGFERRTAIYFEIHENRVRVLSILHGGKAPRKIDVTYKRPRP